MAKPPDTRRDPGAGKPHPAGPGKDAPRIPGTAWRPPGGFDQMNIIDIDRTYRDKAGKDSDGNWRTVPGAGTSVPRGTPSGPKTPKPGD